jgi:hypothetical protein
MRAGCRWLLLLLSRVGMGWGRTLSDLDEVSVENEIAQISQLCKSSWELGDVVARDVQPHQTVQVRDFSRNLVDLVPTNVELDAVNAKHVSGKCGGVSE